MPDRRAYRKMRKILLWVLVVWIWIVCGIEAARIADESYRRYGHWGNGGQFQNACEEWITPYRYICCGPVGLGVILMDREVLRYEEKYPHGKYCNCSDCCDRN